MEKENFMFGIKRVANRGSWVAQSVKGPTSAQVMISQLVNSSPVSGSVLTAQNIEPASDSVSLFLSAPPLLMLCLSVSLSLCLKINIKFFKRIANLKIQK